MPGDEVETRVLLMKENKAEKRRAARRFTDEDTPPVLAAADADLKYLLYWPTKHQWRQWNSFLLLKKFGVSPDGEWFGWCPEHDDKRDPDTPTAMFNFPKGSLRCLGDVSCSAPRRVRSLSNAYEIKLKRTIDDAATG